VTRRMGAKKLQSRSKVKPFIKVRHFLLCLVWIRYRSRYMTGCQLFASLPDTLLIGAREFEGDSELGYFQGAITTRRCEEDH
jgi:hypothetical protein